MTYSNNLLRGHSSCLKLTKTDMKFIFECEKGEKET